jgi:hypothetical protein
MFLRSREQSTLLKQSTRAAIHVCVQTLRQLSSNLKTWKSNIADLRKQNNALVTEIARIESAHHLVLVSYRLIGFFPELLAR